ncbi:MAG TPA: hypothetical protein VFW11_12460 [Cyclobacteriaceae bacterium]|nr:hypothetical protein [Cyclobacteriaceae bacterium]
MPKRLFSNDRRATEQTETGGTRAVDPAKRNKTLKGWVQIMK